MNELEVNNTDQVIITDEQVIITDQDREVLNPNEIPKIVKAKRGGQYKDLDKKQLTVNVVNVVKHLAAMGCTEELICKVLNISHQRLSYWKKNAKFANILAIAKDEADTKVVKSLFDLATGYKTRQAVTSSYKGKLKVQYIDKTYVPSIIAIIYWLNNRQRDTWRNQTYYKEEGNTRTELTMDEMNKLIETELIKGKEKVKELLDKTDVHTSEESV